MHRGGRRLFDRNRYMNGAVAQLGERLTGSQEVVGSIPSGSTFLNILYILFTVLH